MTAADAGLEQDKHDKIADVASRGATLAASLGQDPDAAAVFLRHYFRHVDAADVSSRSVENLLGLVESHYRAALRREPGQSVVLVRTPRQSDDGWTAGGATVVQVVTDDRPFLVDSLTMEVLRQGWSVREVFHPQFLVRRDTTGELQAVVRREQAKEPGVLPESWMHLEILPPRPSGPEGQVAALQRGLQEVLLLVEESVEDWQQMIDRSTETAALLADPSLTGGRAEEASLAQELLGWLTDNHFTFLGYREYRLDGDGNEARYVIVPDTGLGILRGDLDHPDAFHALPQPGTRHLLMIITKDNYRSRVHRPAYLDYLGLRTFDANGRVTGERRFLGLFSSSAYSESIARVPVLRQKAAAVLAQTGYDEHSHGGKAVLDVLETYPRDELFQAPLVELAATVEKIAHLKERRQVRMFVRSDPYGRYLSCLVYLPRDRYTTAVRRRMENLLLTRLGGATIEYTARVTESVLARLHFVLRMPLGRPLGDLDIRGLERELTLTTRSWEDDFADLVGELDEAERLTELASALPEAYKEDYAPGQAIHDLTALSGLTGPASMSMTVHPPVRDDDEADLRLKIFRRDASMSLSRILPHLTLLGVDVIDERPYELVLRDERAFVYDFGLTVPGGRAAAQRDWTPATRQRFVDAFAASYRGHSESDRFNNLVLGAGLDWHQVSVLRAVGRYLRQAGSTYSQTYLAQALSANVDLARRLVDLFETKFDPRRELDAEARTSRVEALTRGVTEGLDDVASLDHDRILRSYLAVLTAAVRTNYFAPDRRALALKLLPREIPDLPEPRPEFEIFVYSARVEGVHLRFGTVARGGLRWSDRAEDFRTEILGLVKAQMVKNAVIVPVGAKGGFYAKQLPDPAADREAWLAEGIACYQLFITSLLDLTDNLVDGVVVTPEHVLRYDGDDPYLVVAADKGTSTFSDVANALSVESGFWLGDAFASGGSAGYDHKAMGITARGAWESVTRHFRELGVDPRTDDFTCVGIGDMSGDVFGNGMLLSRHTLLVAAFDHRHIFLDPHPDPEQSWLERARLFDLPRSSWADYDTSLISAGGGIHPRTRKSIPLTPEVREVLGIDASVTALAPAELISACLRAPVDLLWNGGIGTYVKSAAGEQRRGGGQGQRRVARRRRRAAGPGRGGGGQPGAHPAGSDRVRRPRRPDQHRSSRQLGRRRHLRPRGQHQDPALGRGRCGPALACRPGHLARLHDRRGGGAGARSQRRAEPGARQQRPAGARDGSGARGLDEPARGPGPARPRARVPAGRGGAGAAARLGAGADRTRARDPAGLHQDRAGERARAIRPARRSLPGAGPGRLLPGAAAGALRRPDAGAPAAPGDHHDRRGQPVRRHRGDHLLPPVVGGDRRRTHGGGPGACRGPGGLRGRRARRGGPGPGPPGGRRCPDRAPAGGAHPGGAGGPLAAQPASSGRHPGRGGRAGRGGAGDRRGTARSAARAGARGPGAASGPLPRGRRTGAAGHRRGRAASRVCGALGGADRSAGRPGGPRRRRRALRPRAAPRPRPAPRPDHRAAALRPLADDGEGGAPGRPPRGARRPDRAGPHRTRAVHGGTVRDARGGRGRGGRGERLGGVRARGRGVGAHPALDLRGTGGPRPGLGRAADRTRAAADPGMSAPSVPPRERGQDRRSARGRSGGMRIDLHTHSSTSDGTDSPAELVENAARAGLDVVALTDHDTFDGLDAAVAAGEQVGVQVVRGLELSCAEQGSSVHLLGYGVDPSDPTLAAEMRRVRDGREGRLGGVLAKLEELGVGVSEESVRRYVGDSPSVGRPHIADAMIEAGHVQNRTEAFDRFLSDGGPAHVERYAIPLARGIDLVRGAGGVAVIAHPWGRGRERVLPPEMLAALAAEHDLDGIEVDHQDHDRDTRRRLRALVKRLDLLGTGSSDYHGTGKTDHDLGCNTTAPEVYAEIGARMAARVG